MQTYTENEIAIFNAAKALAALDNDHATVQNGIGFNQSDTMPAHAILKAYENGEHIAFGSIKWLYKALKKYSKTQLPNFGINYADLVEPKPVETVKTAKKAGKFIRLDGTNKTLAETIKTFDRATYRTEDGTGKHWLVLPSANQVSDFVNFLKANNFQIDDNVGDLLLDITNGQNVVSNNDDLTCELKKTGLVFKLYFNRRPTDEIVESLQADFKSRIGKDDDGFYYEISSQRELALMMLFGKHKIALPDYLETRRLAIIAENEAKSKLANEYQQKMIAFMNSGFLEKKFNVVNGGGIGITGKVRLSEQQKEAIRHAVSIPGMNSLLWIGVGVGKTLIKLCIAKIALEAGLKPIISVPGGLVHQWKDSVALFGKGLFGRVEIVSRQNANLELTDKPRFIMLDESEQGTQNADTATFTRMRNICLDKNTFGNVFSSATPIRGMRHEHAAMMAVVFNIPSVRNANSKTDALNLFMRRFGKEQNADQLASEFAPFTIKFDGEHLEIPKAIETIHELKVDGNKVNYFKRIFERLKEEHARRVANNDCNDGGMLALLNALRRAYAVAMAKTAAMQILDRLDAGHKVLSAVNFVDAGWRIHEALLKIRPELRIAMAIGGREVIAKAGKNKGKKVKRNVSTSQKAKMANDFQNGDYDVMILQMKGTSGLNLTASTCSVAFDMPWINDTLHQFYGRNERQGQTKQCQFDVLLGMNLGESGKLIGQIMWSRIVRQRHDGKSFVEMLKGADRTMNMEKEAAQILAELFS